jgi:hypothetical protein
MVISNLTTVIKVRKISTIQPIFFLLFIFSFVLVIIRRILMCLEIYRGGRKFGFLSLPPLGCVPFTRTLKVRNTGSCYEEITALAKLHNEAFPKVLQKLQHQLNGFRYSIADVYTAFSERINNPSKYGMSCPFL